MGKELYEEVVPSFKILINFENYRLQSVEPQE